LQRSEARLKTVQPDAVGVLNIDPVFCAALPATRWLAGGRSTLVRTSNCKDRVSAFRTAQSHIVTKRVAGDIIPLIVDTFEISYR
jgi:hypothetical protein